MVLRNVAKTFSLEEQRQEINEIAVDLDAVNTTLTNWNASQWDTAYGWGDHALAGYLVATTTDKTNWNTAFGWGDHASAGYLTAYQTDAQIKSSYEANADTNAFTDAFQTKLNGIETGATADQTAAEIRTLVGSASDSNVFTDAEQTKLSGIETGATADQTGAEIKTAYEGEADTNAFTDAEQTKLSGIEAGATVNAATGGTSGGIGTQADPQYGSVQFRGGTNTLLGDSLFVYETTNNRLSIGQSVGGTASLNVVTPGDTSVDTAYFHASDSGANNRIRINTVANQGGHPYIKFDAGGSNFIVGELYAGTTDNKLVLGVGEDPTGVTGISIDGNGKFTHAGGKNNNSGGANLSDGQYNMITASKSIGPNDNKTFTISGLQSGWMRITGGGYSSAGQSQFAIFYTMGGYMTATSTYDVAKHQEWGAGVSISTSKNTQSYDITLTNNSSSYTLSCHFTVESSSGNLKITSN